MWTQSRRFFRFFLQLFEVILETTAKPGETLTQSSAEKYEVFCTIPHEIWLSITFYLQKRYQKIIWGLYLNHMHICRPWQKTTVKFRKNCNETVGGVASTRYLLSIHFVIDNARNMATFNLRKKVTKYNLRIISQPHAYFQTMNKTPVKFRKNRYKTVGEFVPRRYPLSIYIVIDNAGTWLSSTCEKSDKNNLRIIFKPHYIFSDNDQNISEVSKWPV